jgi:hypothetical protein
MEVDRTRDPPTFLGPRTRNQDDVFGYEVHGSVLVVSGPNVSTACLIGEGHLEGIGGKIQPPRLEGMVTEPGPIGMTTSRTSGTYGSKIYKMRSRIIVE